MQVSNCNHKNWWKYGSLSLERKVRITFMYCTLTKYFRIFPNVFHSLTILSVSFQLFLYHKFDTDGKILKEFWRIRKHFWIFEDIFLEYITNFRIRLDVSNCNHKNWWKYGSLSLERKPPRTPKVRFRTARICGRGTAPPSNMLSIQLLRYLQGDSQHIKIGSKVKKKVLNKRAYFLVSWHSSFEFWQFSKLKIGFWSRKYTVLRLN